MRRVTAPRTPVRPSARRRTEEADEQQHQERPEIRRDIRRIWWPDAADDPGGPGGGYGVSRH